MEEAVSISLDPVALALHHSMTAGNELAPTELLSVIEADPDPILALGDMDRGNAYFAPVQRELEFLQVWRVAGKAPSREEQERLDALMRWLRREFRDWNSAGDNNYRRLVALCVIAAFCSQHGDFWPAFSASGSVNPEIAAEISKRLAGLRVTLSPSNRSLTPISDQSILDRFNAADRAGEWATLACEWPKLGDFLFPDTLASQSVSYLHAFASDALLGSVDQIRQIAPLMLVLSCLSAEDCLKLAFASTNPYLRFGSILRLFQQPRQRGQSISLTEEDLLTRLLEKIAVDRVQWNGLMLAFNAYPVRYPQLQVPLGRALARASDACLAEYINAIGLTNTGIGRRMVADCLGAFRSVASLDQRKKLWTLAHDRWLQWGFGEHEQTETLMRIGSSELDYGIVGYARECMSVEQLSERCAAISAECQMIDHGWHGSVVLFIEAISRLLSKFQPYDYARQIDTDGEWLIAEGRYVLPFDPHSDRYLAMFYQFRYVIPGWAAAEA